jgi:hypothetical protein
MDKSIPLKPFQFYIMETKGWSKLGAPKAYKMNFLERHFESLPTCNLGETVLWLLNIALTSATGIYSQ